MKSGLGFTRISAVAVLTNGRKQRGTKESHDEGNRGEWKAGLKLNMQKIKITTSGYTSSCRIDGQTMETVINFIFLGSENHCVSTFSKVRFDIWCTLINKSITS